MARYPPGAPLRTVTVSSFALDLREVTVSRFWQFYRAGMPNGAQVVRYPGGEWRPHVFMPYVEPQRDADAGVVGERPDRFTWDPRQERAESNQLPVVRVNQTVAQAFCVWDGGRLPTVTEMRYLLRCWPHRANGGMPSRYPLGDARPACDDGNWGGGAGGGMFKPCPLRTRQITTGGRFRPYGPFYDLIGNVEEWRADRCEPMSRSGPDPLCVNGAAETSPGLTEQGSYFFDGGTFEYSTFIPSVADGTPSEQFPGATSIIPGRQVDWGPMPSSRNPVDAEIFGFRCAYDVP